MIRVTNPDPKEGPLLLRCPVPPSLGKNGTRLRRSAGGGGGEGRRRRRANGC